jgi:hypothetical protein
MDQIFGEPGAPVFPDPREAGLVGRAVLATAEGRRRYRETMAALMPKVLDPAALGARVRETAALIRPAIVGDDEGAGKEYDEAVTGLRERIAERARIVREALDRGEPAPRKPAALEDGRTRPGGWETRAQVGEPELIRSTREGIDGGPALAIRIPERTETCASWRTRLLLPAGRYRLSGLVRLRGVEPFEEEGEGAAGGACLRISGKQPGAKLVGNRGWTRIEFEFAVEGLEEIEGEGATGEVELVAELRASKGTAWFDEGSIEVRKLP